HPGSGSRHGDAFDFCARAKGQATCTQRASGRRILGKKFHGNKEKDRLFAHKSKFPAKKTGKKTVNGAPRRSRTERNSRSDKG
ncbi:MAG: hypothetical protein ACK6DC_08610, partial [Planctomycetota bacterium]